ncbi:hypothetical protein PpBr36_00486 [Pyricularia pennisetigena]|uniref:hypothetical protein n=1 Tax=Pyricularia pennisetigena TaxID=1578925 RepID=UPI0011506CCD|nr:hypothetical protein PpBr36_00486 [Pyricularia pennisetigena]TLS28182.1 hypothetical protein PpBr36_00486 [Pyricularia pennisetigena]
MSLRRVVLTGIGAITPLGVGAKHSWRRLIAGASGITSVKHLEPLDRWQELPSTVAGLVPTAAAAAAAVGAGADADAGAAGDVDGGKASGLWRPSDWLDATDQRRMSRFAQYAVASADMALEDARWRPKTPHDLEATGVCLGSGIGNLEEIYNTALAHQKYGYKKVSPLFAPKILINLAAGHIAMRYGFCGPNHAATTACTTGAHSIGDAARFIAFGDADVMVAGGSESCIHPLTFAGFARSRSLSTAFNDNPSASCRPFDESRDGFVVAEGAAVVVLEELEHALRRGARILAELRGYGCSGDAHHMTAPREDGSGALTAMKKALKHAGVRPAEVDYINAHATGTRSGDAAEALAIRSLMLGDEGFEREDQVTVSSTKGSTGHLLGAAGAIEAVFTALAVSENRVPPTRNLVNPGVGPNFNFVANQAQEKTRVPGVYNQTYRVYNYANNLYKSLSKQAPYKIDPNQRKKGLVKKAEDGEEIGEGSSPWHTELGLPPTFSTWAQITMMHMYLAVVRYRCLPQDAFEGSQKSLVDAFFYEAEERMDVHHGMSSRSLRQHHLKDLFVAWRGLMLAYDEGIVRGDAVLGAAVWRNLFKGDPDVDVRKVAAVVSYMRASLKRLDQLKDEDALLEMHKAFRTDLKGELQFVDIPAKELVGILPKAGEAQIPADTAAATKKV